MSYDCASSDVVRRLIHRGSAEEGGLHDRSERADSNTLFPLVDRGNLKTGWRLARRGFTGATGTIKERDELLETYTYSDLHHDHAHDLCEVGSQSSHMQPSASAPRSRVPPASEGRWLVTDEQSR